MAMCAHAAGESSPGNLPSGTYAIVLKVKNEAKLKALSDKLKVNSIEHVLIDEPDEPFNGQAMAIGVIPRLRNDVSKFFKGIQLYK